MLLEVRKRFPEAFRHLELYIDGGFERGSDILKAIALGATAVGIARPFLFSLVYGQEGVEHLSRSKLCFLIDKTALGNHNVLNVIHSLKR